jgi:histidine triad (HIT) family protein
MINCIFCKLNTGDAPARIVYRTASSFAFFPLSPGVRGHTVIAPVRHVATWTELDREDVTNLFLATHEVSELLCAKLRAAAVNVLFAGGPEAGQSVGHFHVHVLPRWRDDGVEAWPDLPGYGGDVDADLREITGR